jgi:hypothetical protein
MISFMSGVDPYSRVIRQAAHDAVRVLLSTPPDSVEASSGLGEVLRWLGREHGPHAVSDLAEELAVDLAEALEALAGVERRDPLELADRWFHDQAPPPQPARPPGREPGRPCS